MGFFVSKVNCDVCGREVGWKRWPITKDNAWCCNECLKKAQKNGPVLIDKITIDGIKKLIDGNANAQQENKEYRKKCNVCGHIFCYTDSDLLSNKLLAEKAKTLSTVAFVESLGGSRITSNQNEEASERTRARIVDYNRCPQCHSTDLTDATEEEIHQAANGNSNSSVSAADEIKKYKELLDSGIISQEEFDAKKKQLLGL